MQYKLTPLLVLAVLGFASATPVASPGNVIKEPWNWCANNWRCNAVADAGPTSTASDAQLTATASAISAVGTGVMINGTAANCSTTATPPASTTTPVTPLNTTTPTPPKNTTVPVTGDAKDLNAPMGTVYLGMGLLAAAGYLAVL
jgi:hypothetical protein